MCVCGGGGGGIGVVVVQASFSKELVSNEVTISEEHEDITTETVSSL